MDKRQPEKHPLTLDADTTILCNTSSYDARAPDETAQQGRQCVTLLTDWTHCSKSAVARTGKTDRVSALRPRRPSPFSRLTPCSRVNPSLTVSPNRNRRTSRSRRLARSWGCGSDRRCGAAGNPPPFRPVPPCVRFFDRTGAATPPNGEWEAVWAAFWTKDGGRLRVPAKSVDFVGRGDAAK
jgi:hypothetical protein